MVAQWFRAPAAIQKLLVRLPDAATFYKRNYFLHEKLPFTREVTFCKRNVLSKSNVQLHEIEIKGKLYDEIVTILVSITVWLLIKLKVEDE